MKQKQRTKRLLALALLLASVLGLAWGSQVMTVSVAGTEREGDTNTSAVLMGCNPDPICTEVVNNVQLIRVNVADPRISVKPGIMPDENRALVRTIVNIYEGAVVGINADYFSPSCWTNCWQGATWLDGEYKAPGSGYGNTWQGRRNIRWSTSKAMSIDFGRDTYSPEWHNAVGGGPQFVRDGSFWWDEPQCYCLNTGQPIPCDQQCSPPDQRKVIINGEHFDAAPGTTQWFPRSFSSRMSAVGFSGSTMVLATSWGSISNEAMGNLLASQGVVNALRLDGGGSTQMYSRYPGAEVDLRSWDVPERAVADALLVYVQDVPPPPPPSLNSPCNGQHFVSCTDITLEWDESSGATQYQAKYEGPSSNTSDWMTGTSWDVGTLAPGDYSWQARAKNEWDTSDWSDKCYFTVNPNQAPNTPSPQSPGDGAWVNSRTVTLQWQDNGDDGCPRSTTYNVELWRSGWSNSVSDYSGTSWQVTVPSDADYQWHVQAYDGSLTSGWSGYRTVKVDATPPDTSITDGPSGVIPTGSATFTWTGSDNRTSTGDLKYSYRLVGLSSDWSSWSTATSVTYNDLMDGDYTFEVKAKDEASNVDPSPANRSFGVDVTPPETTITGGPSGCIVTADVTFTWTGSDNRTSTDQLQYRYKLEGFDDWSAWTSATSKSYTGLSDGDYTFKVKAKDGVGHEDPSPAARSFRVDTTPPTGSVLVNGGDSTTNKITVHLDITGDDGSIGCGLTEMRLSNDDHNWEAWESFATEGGWLLPTLNRTTWTVHLQLKDLVGNVSGAFTDDIYLDLYPPRPSSESYQLGARVLASGDPTSISESYGLLSATMGQPIADGRMQGADYRLESGYQGAWPSVPRGRLLPESYDINPSVMASSGGHQASENYQLVDTAGQPVDYDRPSSENYQMTSGYWGMQPMPCRLPYDLNGNGRVDVGDIMLVASRWGCRSVDECYRVIYDLDHDGDIDIVDIMKVAARWGETC